jgi:hypothetical protein
MSEQMPEDALDAPTPDPEVGQHQLSEAAQNAVNAEQQKFDELTNKAVQQAQKDHLAKRVFELAIENAELKERIAELESKHSELVQSSTESSKQEPQG